MALVFFLDRLNYVSVIKVATHDKVKTFSMEILLPILTTEPLADNLYRPITFPAIILAGVLLELPGRYSKIITYTCTRASIKIGPKAQSWHSYS